ncbi:hypothetical protein OBK08_11640 [Empedobacter falsenii]|uniref:Helix-turn-helix domain-containing protein n=1 Tax=Empedobacter falsenii TaxID=343874 RepID=A0ABY8V9I0_9FLAO|nr:hypothetical protein [Empedobacter falsenii]WIH97782.1 hypothetical protein OBA43_02260 [Empedobacter falsenii]
MAGKEPKKNYKLTDILYSADIRKMLRWSRSTLQRYEEKGLPFFRADEKDEKSLKMYIEEDVVSWLLRHKRGA